MSHGNLERTPTKTYELRSNTSGISKNSSSASREITNRAQVPSPNLLLTEATETVQVRHESAERHCPPNPYQPSNRTLKPNVEFSLARGTGDSQTSSGDILPTIVEQTLIVSNDRSDNMSPVGNMAAGDLEAMILRITRSVVSEERIGTGEQRTQSFSTNLPSPDFDKIPDPVKCLRDFSGNTADFNSWRSSVDRILDLYKPWLGTAKYLVIISAIRNKIIGEADAVLESYNVELDWKKICHCLTLHYADRRDLNTLEYEMFSFSQGGKSVEEFYQKINSHLSLIINKLSRSEANHVERAVLTSCYRKKALDAFIRGLKGDMPRLLALKEMDDLPQALNLAIKIENQTVRDYRVGFNQNRSVDKPNNSYNESNVQNTRPQRDRPFQYTTRPYLTNNTSSNNRFSGWQNRNSSQATNNRYNNSRPSDRERNHSQPNFHADTSSLQVDTNSQCLGSLAKSGIETRLENQGNQKSDVHEFSDIHFLG